jgi:hypothetical protein
MRRLVTVCSLAMLAVCGPAAPADAYFWEWLDSLSGPRFGGVIGELQLVCPGKADLAHSIGALDAIKRQLAVEGSLHAEAKNSFSDPAAQRFVDTAVRYRLRAEEVLGDAMRLVSEDLLSRQISEARKSRVTATVLTALAWQERAAAHFAWAQRLQKNDRLDPRKQPGTYDDAERMSTDDEVTTRMAPLAGVRYSLCHYRALQRDRFFVSGNVGFAVDIKNDDEHSPGRHLMLTTGGSAHAVVTPWLTAGVGAGRAFFFPSGGSKFGKWYFQPYIVDIKPGAMVPRAELRSPWRHFVYVRYSMITFPQGFEASRFSPNSAAYEQEWIQSLGIHFDLTPVLRGRKGNW